MVGRLNVPEIMDSERCPEWLRDSMTSYLQVVIDETGLYDGAAPAIADALILSESSHILDLDSGIGGPWPGLAESLATAGSTPGITLSDLYPNATAASRVNALERLSYSPNPISALDVPPEMVGMRTMFTALHHVPSDQVRSILRSAQDARVPFAAFETTHRSLWGVLVTLLIPVMVLVPVPRIKPVSLLTLLLTYLPPLLPVLIWWEGLASTLRTYRAFELQEMISEIADPSYS